MTSSSSKEILKDRLTYLYNLILNLQDLVDSKTPPKPTRLKSTQYEDKEQLEAAISEIKIVIDNIDKLWREDKNSVIELNERSEILFNKIKKGPYAELLKEQLSSLYNLLINLDNLILTKKRTKEPKEQVKLNGMFWNESNISRGEIFFAFLILKIAESASLLNASLSSGDMMKPINSSISTVPDLSLSTALNKAFSSCPFKSMPRLMNAC